MKAKIIAIGAGKGGVGKSFVASSLGITLTKLNRSVLLVDFDLGGANLHTHLGAAPSSPSLLSFLEGKNSMANLIKPSSIPKLSYVQGAWEGWEIPPCSKEISIKMVSELKALPFDFIIIDLGPGATAAHMQIFKNADEKLLITSAEPTALEKTYRFLESWIMYEMSLHSTADAFNSLKSALREFRATKKKGHFSFRDYLEKAGGFSFDYFAALESAPLRLIVNGTRSHQDQQLGYSIKSVCKKYFDLPISYLGPIDYDNAVWHSVRSREPFLVAKPFTALSGQFLSLSKSLMEAENSPTLLRAVV
jgi:flagellar biosynthesis protein FlhG